MKAGQIYLKYQLHDFGAYPGTVYKVPSSSIATSLVWREAADLHVIADVR